MFARKQMTLFSPENERYESLSDYRELTPLEHEDPEHPHRYTAIKKRFSEDACYDNLWFILTRQGEYGAQIEKVAAEIYNYFIGYATQISIVENSKKFYASSRKIKNYINWNDALKFLAISDNGQLIYQADTPIPVINLGKIAALTDFFSDTDCHSSNFGLQLINGCYRAFKIDNEHMFSFDNDSEGSILVEDELKVNYINPETMTTYLSSPAYLNEKHEMFSKIAETNFEILERIIRKEVTGSKLLSTQSMLLEQLEMIETDDERIQIETALNQIKELNPDDYGVESIIKTLKEKHENLQTEFKTNKARATI